LLHNIKFATQGDLKYILEKNIRSGNNTQKWQVIEIIGTVTFGQKIVPAINLRAGIYL